MNLKDFKEKSSRLAFGMTIEEAYKANVCIRCKKPPEFQSDLGRREYMISAVCEPCFDEMFPPEDK